MEERSGERVDDGEAEDTVVSAVGLDVRGPGGQLGGARGGYGLEGEEGGEGVDGRELEAIC